jgi:hypothetical protein
LKRHNLDITASLIALMGWVWAVTTASVVVTFITVKRRGYKNMPRALRGTIAADAIFGALFLLHALL